MRAYHAELTSDGIDYPWEACWEEYRRGGAERWLWFLGLLQGMCPDVLVQRFHDQVLAFLLDHGLDAENIGMPRV